MHATRPAARAYFSGIGSHAARIFRARRARERPKAVKPARPAPRPTQAPATGLHADGARSDDDAMGYAYGRGRRTSGRWCGAPPLFKRHGFPFPPTRSNTPGARQSKRNEVVLPPLSGAGARDLIPTARPCRGRAVWPYHWYLPSDAPKA